MFTLKIFVVLAVLLLVLGIVAFVLDNMKAAIVSRERPNTYRVIRGCSFLVKFGMVLIACGLVGSIASTAAAITAMAFAIPKPTRVPQGSWFDHSHNVATTLPFGAIVPVDWRFLNPGEKVKQNISGFCRALQLKAPAMQDIDLKWATFFVPARILCDKTEDIVATVSSPSMITSTLVASSGDDPSNLDPIDIISQPAGISFPYFLFNKSLRDDIVTSAKAGSILPALPCYYFQIGSLMDYMGFPCETVTNIAKCDTTAFAASFPINMLPFKAYHAICNHYFMDDCFRREDISKSVEIKTSEVGVQSFMSHLALFSLRYSQYESDPILKCSTGSRITRINAASSAYNSSGSSDDDVVLNANSIRGMFALDEFARKLEYFYGDMRKQIKYMFGVQVSDKSALSPILVDAGSQPVQVSEVVNTTLQDVESEQSRQSAGKLISAFGAKSKIFEAEELGVYMTLAWIRPRSCYLNRMNHQFENYLTSSTIPNPLFAEIGDSVIKRRVFDFQPFQSESITEYSDANFGYNTRYVLEKYSFDSFTGDFRDNLAYWHCAREFTPYSPLSPNYAFRLINEPGQTKDDVASLNRIFSVITAVDGARPFQLQMRFKTDMWQLYPHIDNEL